MRTVGLTKKNKILCGPLCPSAFSLNSLEGVDGLARRCWAKPSLTDINENRAYPSRFPVHCNHRAGFKMLSHLGRHEGKID